MALTLLHADTGTHADGDMNGATMSDGLGTWSGQGANNWFYASNRMTGSGSENVQTAYDSAMTGLETDQKAEAKVYASDSGVTCRRSATNAYYLAYVPTLGGASTKLYYYNGSFTEIGSSSDAFASGDLLGISAVGTTIKVYKNGVEIISVTDATYSAGYCGLYGVGSSFTDFADYVEAAAGGQLLKQLQNNGLFVGSHL